MEQIKQRYVVIPFPGDEEIAKGDWAAATNLISATMLVVSQRQGVFPEIKYSSDKLMRVQFSCAPTDLPDLIDGWRVRGLKVAPFREVDEQIVQDEAWINNPISRIEPYAKFDLQRRTKLAERKSERGNMWADFELSAADTVLKVAFASVPGGGKGPAAETPPKPV